jgi:hypothetical protein
MIVFMLKIVYILCVMIYDINTVLNFGTVTYKKVTYKNIFKQIAGEYGL